MIRTVLNKGREYYVITTKVDVGGVESSAQLHFETTGLSKEDKLKVYKYCILLLSTLPTPEISVNKPWYKFW
jgi:hypothetical protein